MHLPTLTDIESAAQVVYREFAATPQYAWGMLADKLGTTCWLKHENHTPVGAFKIRGGLTYFDQLAQRGALPKKLSAPPVATMAKALAGLRAHTAWRAASWCRGATRSKRTPPCTPWV